MLERAVLSLPGEHPAEPDFPFTRAAVAMPFHSGRMLMIKRAERDGDPWSGHMAFPGGKEEPQDASPVAIATREAREELALDLSGASLLGEVTPLRTPFKAKGKVHYVHGFVFEMDSSPLLTPNDEVHSVHWFELERLLDGEGRGSFEWRGWEMPSVTLDGCFIWGLSLRLIDDLLGRIRAG